MSEIKILEDLKVHGDLKPTGAIHDSGDSPGTIGQILQSTATGTDWVDGIDISAGDAEAVRLAVKNTSGATITKGTPVYITGNVGGSDRLEIAPSDASDAAKMPAVGLLESDLINNAEGYVAQGGFLKQIATDTIDGTSTTSNDTVYVKAGGGLTMTKPTGTNYIQNVAKVARVHASNGSLVVSSILRTNDVPTPLYIDHTNQRLGIGTTSPSTKLEVDGITTSNGFRTKSSSGNYSIITRDASGNAALYVQSANNATDQPIARFIYGNTSPNQGSLVLNVAKDKSYFSNTNLGIGTDSPEQLLHIHATGNNAKALIIEDDVRRLELGRDMIAAKSADGTSNQALYINPAHNTIFGSSGGNVGIGTTSPDSLLNIEGTKDTAILTLGSNYNASGWAVGDKIGGIDFYSADQSGAGSGVKASISYEVSSGTTGATNALVFNTAGTATGTNNTERMRITHGGNVGIGNTNPSYKLDVSGDTLLAGRVGINIAPSSDYQLNMQFDNTNANDDFHFAQRIDGNFSGADNTDDDREQGAIYIDIDSSADGDASNEHKLYGIYSDVRFSGFSDRVYGAFNRVESNNNTESTTSVMGVYNYAVHDTGSSGGVDSVVGSLNYAVAEDNGTIGSTIGSHSVALVNSTRASNLGVTYGSISEVQIDSPSSITYDNITASFATIDNNEGSVPTATNSYLFRGSYSGTRFATNAYGLHVAGDKHYLEGKVGIGTTSPADALTLYDSDNNVGVYFQTLNSGTGSGNGLRVGLNNTHAFVWNYENTPLSFATNGSQKATILANGNFGIGTTSPIAKLEVNTGSSAAYFTRTAGDNGVTNPVIALSADSSRGILAASGASLDFRVRAVGTANPFGGSTMMRIQSNGDVGIGDTSPSSRLQVYDSTEGQYMEIGAGDGGGRSLVFTSSNNNGSAGAKHNINAKSINGVISFSTAGNERVTINSNGNVTFSNDLTVSGGDITLGGTGRIQGIDTVSSGTDAANKSYVDNITKNKIVENPTITFGQGSLQWTDLNGNGGTGLNGGTPQNPFNDWHHHIIMNHSNSAGYYVDIAASFHNDRLHFRRKAGSDLQDWQEIFHDAYHPNADKWTTARTITLGGDLSGDVSIDGSANATLTATVANDSHTHDGRYYTESEIQTFFNRGYINSHSATNLAVGWYTIATNTGNRAMGEFQIWDVASSDHQSVLFNASHHYGTDSSNDINVLANSRFGGSNFRYIRIKENSTYDGAALQVYIDANTNAVLAAITGANAQSAGWVLKDWIADATDPGDVDNWSSFTAKVTVDLDEILNGGMLTSGSLIAQAGIAAIDGTNVVSEYSSTNYARLESNASGGVIKGSGGNGFMARSYGDSYFNGGNFGIGTTSPSAPLHVYKSAHPNTMLARFENPTGQGLVEIKSQNDAISILQFADSEDGNPGAVQYSHADNSMRFKTADAESLRITSNGNVGIGTTSPTGLTSGVGSLSLGGTNTTTSGGLFFQVNGTYKAYNYVSGNNFIHRAQSGAYQTFYTDATERMRINSSGNVGIGTTSPGEKLEVNGKIKLGPNSSWSKSLIIGGNANNSTTDAASIGITNGNLHLDAANGSWTTFLNYYDGTGGVAFGNGNAGVVAFMGPDGDLWKGTSDNNGSKYWHAGNDGSSSGLDADLLDAREGSEYLVASDRKIYTSLGASATQAKRHHIGRLYYCPGHWDTTWQNMRITVHEETYSGSYVEYHLHGYYLGGTETQNIELKVVDHRGYTTDLGRYKLSLGAHTDSGWDSNGKNVYYSDLYVDVSYYKAVRVVIDSYGHTFTSTNPPSGTQNATVLYSTPTVTNITYATDTKINTLGRTEFTSNVGIGTNNPSTKLDVSGSVKASTGFVANGNDVTGYSGHGVEVRVNSGIGGVLSYDRTNSAYKPLDIISSQTAFKIGTSEAMRINSSGEVLINVTANQTESSLTSRQNGSSIEFGHLNQTSGYYGTLGAMYNSGAPFIAFSADNSTNSNNFTTRGKKGIVIHQDINLSGDLAFSSVTNANQANQSLTERMRIDSSGNVGIGTTAPASGAKLTVMGNQTFGLPGSGSNTSGRFLSIEGNADSAGEGSGRIFFTEHNSTTAAMDKYGLSIGYRGGATSVVGASGNTWTGLSQIGNGEWGLFGHNNDATGRVIMKGSRAGTNIDFNSNRLENAIYYKLRAGNGYGINFWNSTSYSIYMSAIASSTRLDTTSDYNMYFKMSGGTNRGFVFMNSGSPVAQIDSTGKVYAEGGLDVSGHVYAGQGVQTITSTSGTINLNTQSYGVFRLTSSLSGTTTLNIQNMKSGQVIDIILTGDQTVNLTSDDTSETFYRVGDTTYDGTATNHLQIVCISDTNSAAIYHFTVAKIASSSSI